MVSTKVIGIFAAGVLLSPFLMPVILALIPVLIGLGCLLGAGIAYLVMAKGTPRLGRCRAGGQACGIGLAPNG